MITIYNNKTNASILIDEHLDNILVTPHLHQEPVHVKIELFNISWIDHARKCVDCGSLLRSFGTDKQDWFLLYNNKKYLIQMTNSGQKGYGGMMIRHPISEYDRGTLMVFALKELEVDALNSEINKALNIEDYEEAHKCNLLLKEAISINKLNNIQ